MRSIICFMFIMILAFNAKSQESNFDWNLILEIDGKIEASNITKVKIIQEIEKGKNLEYKVKYVPGSLKIEDYNPEVFDEGKLYLIFKYFRYDTFGKYFERDYKIGFHKAWLNKDYVILDIYNMDNEENKSKFPSQIDKEYIFGYEISGVVFSWEEGKK